MYYLVKGVGIVISDEDTSFEWIIDAESMDYRCRIKRSSDC